MKAPQVVPKAWGEERIVVNRLIGRGEAGYCGKIMRLRQGWRCSLHWHARKDEVFHVVSGRMLVELSEPGIAHLIGHGYVPRYTQRIVGPGESVLVSPCTVHRFTGIEDCTFIEFSTPDDPADSHRIETSGRAPVAGGTVEPSPLGAP